MFTLTPEIIVIGIFICILLKLFASVAYYTDTKEEDSTENRVLAENLDLPHELPERAGSRDESTTQTPDLKLAKVSGKNGSGSYPVLTEVVSSSNEVERHAGRAPDTSIPSFYRDEDAKTGIKPVKVSQAEKLIPEEPVREELSYAIQPRAITDMDTPPSSMFGPMDFSMDHARDIVSFDRN